MGLRREFSEHRSKTIESFNLVKEDISALNLNFLNARAVLASIEEKITGLGAKVNEINQNLKADIEIQNSTNTSMASKIVDINSFVNSRIANFEREIGKTGLEIERKVKGPINELLRKTSVNGSSLKLLAAKSKSQSLELKKLSKAIKDSEEQARKQKNLLDRRIREIKKTGSELEAKLRSHRNRMQQLNRKIELSAGKRISRRVARRSARRTAKKTTIRKITPKKTITTIRTPKRKITKTVTKNRVKTAKKTPARKEVYEVIREKNPLI